MCELCSLTAFILSRNNVIQAMHESKDEVLNVLSTNLMFGGDTIDDFSILEIVEDEHVNEYKGEALQAELDDFLGRSSGCPL